MSSVNQALDRFVRLQMRRTGTPGVAVGILWRGRRYTEGYGVTNVDHPLAVTEDTLFQIGSTTKTFTATAIMRLIEQGKLDLDAPVRRYLPDLQLKDSEATRKTTLRHLLTHTGGWLGDFFENTGWGDDALSTVVQKMRTIKQLTPLGSVWAYNNAGFYIAGRIIEKVTKKTYEQAIQELILEPLGMDRSFFFPEEVIHQRFAVGHITTGTRSRVATPWRLTRSSAPAGAIISTAGDQLKWAAFHMGDGRAPNGKRLLRSSNIRMMQGEQVQVGSMTDAVGISWLLRWVGGIKTVTHGGTTNGQLSAFVMVPERDFAVTVLTNSTRGREVHRDVVRWALENYIGVVADPMPSFKTAPGALAEFAGKYRSEPSGLLVDVTARNGRLVLQFPTPPSSDGTPPPRIPPMSMKMIGPDKAIVTSGGYRGLRNDFLRSPGGKVRWLRWGGRLYRKVPAGAKKPTSRSRKAAKRRPGAR